MMDERFQTRLSSFSKQVDDYFATYRSKVTSAITHQSTSRYQNYLESIFHSEWFKFAQRIFNNSESATSQRGIFLNNVLEKAGDRFDVETDFGIFLEIEEVEAVLLWPIQFWDRYIKELPPIYVLPLINLDNKFVLHCSLDGSSSNRGGLQQNGSNMMKLRSLDKLDAFRYIISTQYQETRSSSSSSSSFPAGSRQPLGYVSTAEERKRPIETPPRRVEKSRIHISSTASIESIFLNGETNLRVIRAIFIALDVLLLAYRTSRTYVGCRKFYPRKKTVNRFNDCRCLQSTNNARLANGTAHPETSLGIPRVPHSMTGNSDSPRTVITERLVRKNEEETKCCKHRNETINLTSLRDHSNQTGSTDITDSGGLPSEHLQHVPTFPSNSLSQSVSKPDESRVTRTAIAVKCLRSNALPRVLFCILALVLVLVGVNVAVLLLDVERIADLDLFSLYLNAVRLHIHQTQSYAAQDVEHINGVLLKMCQHHMTTELVNLQSIVDYFLAEQRRVLDNYMSEACTVKKQRQTGWSCDAASNLPVIDLQLIPCNFVPLQTEVYTDVHKLNFENDLLRLLEPYITSTRNCIVTVAYTFLSAMVTALITHAASFVIIRRIKRVQTQKHAKQETRQKLTVSCGTDSHMDGPEDEGVDYDFEDSDDVCADEFTATDHPTNVVQDRGDANNSALSEFMYTETKV